MSNYTTNEIRGGMKLLIDGDPYAVIENEYVKPGKGQAFNRIKVRNLRSGRTVEKSYRSGESIEAADVMDSEMQYLYKDGDFWPHESRKLRAAQRRRNLRGHHEVDGGHRLHHHVVEWRRCGDAPAAHRPQGGRDGGTPRPVARKSPSETAPGSSAAVHQ